ncbi:MAG: hypothetical protein IPJ19_01635 [Planctomycetes bacterium]|nr:hypothetical protein [Planctomycetota bacterium]
MWVLAIASGFVASDNDPSAVPPSNRAQYASCKWGAYANLPMLTLVDVTNTGDSVLFRKPKVLRIALGTPSPGITPPTAPQPGNAFTVKTKTVGRKTYAYVGDILGRLYVFDVSGTALLPAPPANTPYLNAAFGGVDQDFLYAKATIPCPVDPYDGQAAGCIDMEIVGNYLYCALGRTGVGVFDLTHPEMPILSEVLDTPGLALGLSVRSVMSGSSTVQQLIVGDTMCGVRIYQ